MEFLPIPENDGDNDDAQPAITVRRQEILDNLKCPVCTEVIFPPVMNCPNGHHICCFCLSKLSECPICRVPTNTSVRNKFAEDFLEKYIVRCSHNLHGCRRHEFKENEAIVKLHEESCKYRKINCWFPNCTEKIMFEFLPNHWEVAHGIENKETDEESFEIYIDSSSPPYTTQAFHLKNSDGHSFLTIFEATKEQASCILYVYGYCSKYLLPCYQSTVTMEVTLFDGQTILTTHAYHWNGPVLHEQFHPSLMESEKRDFHAKLPNRETSQKIQCRFNVKIIGKPATDEIRRKLSIPL